MEVKTSSLMEQLPFWHVEEDDLMVYEDGSLGCGFKLEGADIKSASSGQINELTSNLENFISGTKEGLKLQFFYRLSPSATKLLDRHKEISKDAPEKYKPILESRYKYFKEAELNEELFFPEVYVFVRSSTHTFAKQKFWESKKKFVNITKKQFDDHKSDFLRSVRQIESSLSHARLSPKKLSADEWFNLLFEYFNLSRSEKLGFPKLRFEEGAFEEPFSSQFLLTDLNVHKDSIELGSYHFKTLTLKNLPEGESYAGMVESFLNQMPFHFWVSQSIEIHDQKKEMEKLQLNRRLAHSMASGAKNVSDLESESKLQHLEELISELLEGSEKIISMDFTVIVWGVSKEELETKCDEVLQAFRGMGQSEGLVETLPAFDAFMSAVPGPAKGLRFKKVKSSNCTHLMPIYSYWKGNSNPVCLFQNRDAGLTSFDVFPRELPSWNSLVFASTGIGKSFSVLQIALQFYGQKPTPRIVWIDNGASSERLLDESILDGQFIDLKLESKICLNMLDLPKGEIKPSPSKIKLVLAILEQILRDEDQKGLPKRHKALLEEVIYKTYERKSPEVPILSDLKEALENHEAVEMRNFAQILYSWTGESAYGRMLDGKTNINLEKNLITIEIKGLDVYPDLQDVMLLNFTEFIKSKASEDSSRPTLLIIDEAWKLLQTPSGQAFTIEAYRTFRKFGSGIWCISQNYKDFLKNEEIASAIMPNTTSILILKQTKIDWDDFKNRIQLNDAEVEVVKSLKSVKGDFSEAFLIQNENRAILKIQADPLAYYIATTDPPDKTLIANKEQEHPELNKLEVLQLLAKEKMTA